MSEGKEVRYCNYATEIADITDGKKSPQIVCHMKKDCFECSVKHHWENVKEKNKNELE